MICRRGKNGTYWYKDLRAGCEGRSELIAIKREQPDLSPGDEVDPMVVLGYEEIIVFRTTTNDESAEETRDAGKVPTWRRPRSLVRSAYECGSRSQSAWLGVWFLPRLSATVVTSRISVRARCVTWKRTAAADTNGCTCWIQTSRNTLSSSRTEWQLRLFVRSWVG